MAAERRAPAPAPVPNDGEVHQLPKANVLPLALDDRFEFRKKLLFLHDPDIVPETQDKMIAFERDRLDYGAATREERRQRHGHYFTFWWRTEQAANLKVRLEYRQSNLGNYVLAKEVDVAAKPGTHKTHFEVVGDEYYEDGQVLAWRAVLIEGDRIVALTQSFLWH